jgi:ribosomal protein L37AE/L43A
MTTQVFACPKCGQASSEADYCSECGARIEGGTGVPSPTQSGTALTVGGGFDAATTDSPKDQVCPECQTPRPSSNARFCEVCRYDFVKGAAGEAPVVAAAALPATPPPAGPPPAGGAVGAVARWDVVITVDPTLDIDPEPDLKPPEEPARRIPLDQSENLIGRRDANQPNVPDVRPHDPSVSRRHAKLLVRPDGSVAILDLESANGTFVNGEQILAGVEHPLTVDDVVTIGRWTRLRIEPRGRTP